MIHPEDCEHNLRESTEFGDKLRTWLCTDCGIEIQRGFDEPDPTEEDEFGYEPEDIDDIIQLLDHPAIKGKLFEIIRESIQYDGSTREEIKSIAKCRK